MKGFKRSLIHTSQLIKSKVKGHGTEDDEYEYMAGSIDKLAKNSESLAKYAGQLIDNFHAMSSTLRFMGKAFEEMYLVTEDQPPEEVQQLIKVAEEMDEKAIKPFQANVSKGFIDPANEFHSLFAPIKDKHATRKKVQLEYDYYRDKVKSMSENKKGSTGTEVSRLKEKMQAYEEQYEQATTSNKNDMRDLMDRRPDSLDPMARLLLAEILVCTRKMTEAVEKASAAVSNSSGKSVKSDISSRVGAMSINRVSKEVPQVAKEVPPQYVGDWYYLDESLKQQGPVSFQEMAKFYKKGQLNGESHIFGGNLSEWRKISDERDVQKSLQTL
jgi:predicted  nucleic acid-binding Zn-ribbon protein